MVDSFASVCVSTNHLVVAPVNGVFQSFDELMKTRSEAIMVMSFFAFLALATKASDLILYKCDDSGNQIINRLADSLQNLLDGFTHIAQAQQTG